MQILFSFLSLLFHVSSNPSLGVYPVALCTDNPIYYSENIFDELLTSAERKPLHFSLCIWAAFVVHN